MELKLPVKAKLFLDSNQVFDIEKIHFNTGLVMLKERKKVYNTVSIKNVEFDFTGFSQEEIAAFWRRFGK